MTKKKTLTLLLIVFIIVAGIVLYTKNNEEVAVVTSFKECVDAGYPVTESYPRGCRTPAGEQFVENIGNVLEKENLIRLSSPMPNSVVKSPLKVTGMARGTWYFEASFPVKLKDSTGEIVAIAPAQAQGEWMTEEFVPFEVILTFTNAAPGEGQLILEKDNPSGDPERDESLVIPVRIEANGTVSACRPTGCSGQICSDTDVVSTCEFKPEYSCYQKAKCERQSTGKCGWTETAELSQCLANAKSEESLPNKLP